MNYEEFLDNQVSYGLMGLDLKLKEYLNTPNGFFIEAGANNGVDQNNTKIFEDLFGWKGLLVEPSISAYEACKQNRPNSIVINAALSSKDNIEIVGDFDGHLMSSIDGKRRSNPNSMVMIKTRTLTSILKEHNIKNIDFISLDVEGFEFDVLNGFDFNIWKPSYILIEINGDDKTIIDPYLKQFGYKAIRNLSDFGPHNNPLWDGTHNDYLYKLIK
jgi:FkbM family methyltransferase